MKRIYLVDDHPMLRDGLLRLIAQDPDWEVSGEFSTAAGVLEALGTPDPDLVILDITLPDKNGVELIKDLKARSPDIRILVFSMHDEAIYAERVIRAGAKGYVMKGAASEKLTEAITQVLDGGIYLSPAVSDRILRGLAGRRPLDQLGVDRLTNRELEIFELIGQGKSTAQIASQLNISSKTVDVHRANMKSKLAMQDNSTLVREAVMWVEFGTGEGEC